jgi:hypothetical protein
MNNINIRKSLIRVLFEEIPKPEQLDLFCELNLILHTTPTEADLYKKVFRSLTA